MLTRYVNNPIITKQEIVPSQKGFVVECVLNPGVFTFKDKTWLLLRVAERPIQKEGFISFPIINEHGKVDIIGFSKSDPKLDLSDSRMVSYEGKTFLSTLSHLRMVCSEDGHQFFEPKDINTKIIGTGPLETFGIEDCRVSYFEDKYHLTFTQVSENGVGVGYITTQDWLNFDRHGMIMSPHNKDCTLFEEKINGQYFCLHRPSGIDLGGNFIWLASSPDLLHWGNHQCILKTRPGQWDSARIGSGASPIKTSKGWLEIYHGANEANRYCLGAVLLDINDPSIVLARSIDPIFEPTEDYELNGFFGNVVFTNGHIVNGDEITLYYGASDEVICKATLSIEAILSTLLN
ncbi:MAG: hypothetical protein RLZZ546_1174 [Bacteroidota bacterium]|jgi:predicted GH43/DUF377 family glycosyl hydrolase